MSFSAKDVMKLREKTGCGMMDCKKALTHSNGDESAAIDYLREQGLAAANKKAGRIASEGIAFSMDTPKGGVIIEVNSETDFVAKNEDFQNFVKLCAKCAMESQVKDVDSLLEVNEDGRSIKELLNEKILKIGENIKIRRFDCFKGLCSSYVHAGGKIAVLVNFECGSDVYNNEEFKSMAKDIAMQIAASHPLYLNQSEVPQEVIEHEKKILADQAISQGKPEAIAKRMVEGKIGKYFKENCLLNQEFVKDSSMTVSQYVDKVSKSIGVNISVSRFARYERGEGLEKKNENFAEEVSKALN